MQRGVVEAGIVSCSRVGCSKRPTYGVAGSKIREFCAQHAGAGMVNVDHKRCAQETCPLRAIFGTLSSRRREFCSKHALTGMINLDRKRCIREGCLASPSHGFPGDEKQSLCAEHADDGMVKLSRQRAICPYRGCLVSASYGERGGRAVRFCAAHATEGMVSLGGKRCGREGCLKRATYGAVGTRKREFCARHSREGMVNVNSKKIIYPRRTQQRDVGRLRALHRAEEGGGVCDRSCCRCTKGGCYKRARCGVEEEGEGRRGVYPTCVGAGADYANGKRCPCFNCTANVGMWSENITRCLTSTNRRRLPTYPTDGGGGVVTLSKGTLNGNTRAESRATHIIPDNTTTVQDILTESTKRGVIREEVALGSGNGGGMVQSSAATNCRTAREHKNNTARVVTTATSPYMPSAATEFGVPRRMQRAPAASTQVGGKDRCVERNEVPVADSRGGLTPININGHDTDIDGQATPDRQSEPSTAALPRPGQVSSLIKTEMGWLTWTWGAVGDCR